MWFVIETRSGQLIGPFKSRSAAHKCFKKMYRDFYSPEELENLSELDWEPIREIEKQ